jgi:hypothetical protein
LKKDVVFQEGQSPLKTVTSFFKGSDPLETG